MLRVLRATQLAMAINWNVSTSQVACCHTLSTDQMYTGEDAGADHCLFLSRVTHCQYRQGEAHPPLSCTTRHQTYTYVWDPAQQAAGTS